MHPGQIVPGADPVAIHVDRPRVTVAVRNTSRWCVQVASHMHFFEVNRNLVFDRGKALGMHLDVAAGRAERWEPDEVKEVSLVGFGGPRLLYGFNRLCEGATTPDRLEACLTEARSRGFIPEEA